MAAMTYKTINYGQWGRATEPGSHRKSAVQDQVFLDQMRVIYDRMRMPRERKPVLIDEDGASFGREWADLSIASIGLRVAPLAMPYSWPSWTTETEQGREIYQLWSQRLTIRGSEASACIEWRPDAGLWIDFQGIENAKTEAEVVRLYRAVQLVKSATKRRGPPLGRALDNVSVVRFCQRWRDVKSDIWEKEERRASQSDLADSFGLGDRGAIYDYCREHRLPWPPC